MGDQGLETYVTVGLDHRTAPVAVRERFAVAAPHLIGTLQAMRDQGGVEEAVLLATCNRVEWYLAASPQEGTPEGVLRWFGVADLGGAVQVLRGEEAVRHLFRVASGLESMALGEPQILGQVRDAFTAGRAAGTVGPALDALFRAALACGRRVRREARVDRWATSVPAAAVARAARVVGRLDGSRVLVLGAGKMSEVAARALRAAGVGQMTVANRTRAAAEALARQVAATVVDWDDVDAELARADIVLVSTGAPHVVLGVERVASAVAGRETPLVLVDIAVPRNVDPEAGRIPGVYLYDIDALTGEASRGVATRELQAAETLVEVEVAEFRRARAARRVASAIAAACADAEAIADREWARARDRLRGLSPDQEEVIRTVIRRVVRKVLHRPVARLVEASASTGDSVGR